MGLFFVMVLFSIAVTPSHAEVQAVQTFTDSSWTNTIYYVARLSGVYGQTTNYQDITLHITAVDNYELYVNNTLYNGSNDGDWRTVDTYNINLAGANTVVIGVKVTNRGIGNGNGLIVQINAGTDQIGTTTKMRETATINNAEKFVEVAWWTFDEAGKASLFTTGNWYNIPNADFFKDSKRQESMRRAMSGKINGELDYAFNPSVEVITGYLGDVDTGSSASGGLRLRRIEGQNIALKQPANQPAFTDGDLEVAYTISTPLNQSRYVDLGRIYRVNRMTIYTGGTDPGQYYKTSILGYSVSLSLDESRWEEVGIIHAIGEKDNKGNTTEGGYDHYSVEFPDEWARYVRFTITETRQIGDPSVGEMIVFGIGYVMNGSYESPWLNFGSDTTIKNFDTLKWDGQIPDGTGITIQTMTKSGVNGTPSYWSAPVSLKQFAITSPEPATHIKYRVNLSTQDLLNTPVVKNVSISYSTTDQPLTAADGFITPNKAEMGKSTSFLYTLSYNLAAGQNLKQVAIAVPGYSTLNSLYSTELADTLDASDLTVTSKIDSLIISFNTPLTNISGTTSDTLKISFNTTLLRSAHTFDAFLYNTTMNDGAGGVKAWENKTKGSNVVVVSTLINNILTNVKAVPKVFTPNGDGINDITVIEFLLAKVQTDVKIKIFSTDGTLVRTIEENNLVPSDYRRAPKGGDQTGLPGYWDGKDKDDELVPPGVYIYQVIASTDEKDIIENGTVVVAY